MPLQRLFETALAVSTTAGTAQFNFPAPPTMLVWEGTIGIVGPPNGAQFFALVGGSQWCSWSGNNVGGPVQALPGEEVIVTAVGLNGSTEYTAQWIGFSISRDQATLKYPATSGAGGVVSQPPGSAITVMLQGGASQAILTNASATTTQILGTPAPGTNWLLHNMTFTLGSGTTAAQLVGNSTGFVYAQMLNAAETFFPLMGQVVAEALNLVTAGGGGSGWLSYDTGPPPVSSGGGGVPVVFQLSHSYSVVGAISAQTLPPFFIPVISGQTAILEDVRCQLQSGTSISLALQQNGVTIGGLGAVSVTPVATTTAPPSPVNLANNDAIQAVLSSPVGSPVGLTISIYVQYT